MMNRCLQYSLGLFSALAISLIGSVAHADDFAGASGMSLLSDNAYFCVQDIKSNRAGSRVGVLTIDINEGGYDYTPLEPDWQGELPHDLESVLALRDRPGEFLMCESGAYENWDTHEYHIGRIFHVRLAEEESGWQLEVLGTMQIPEHIHEIEGMFYQEINDGEEWQRKHDPFGEWERYKAASREYDARHGRNSWSDAVDTVNGEEPGSEDDPEPTAPKIRELGILVLATRGGDFAYQPAVFHAFALSIEDGLLQGIGREDGQQLSGMRETQPYTRSVSDLYMDEDGVLWIASCTDQGDSGPFDSIVYRFGKYDLDAPYLRMDTYDSPTWILGGVKVEAICDSMLPNGTLCYATDDEGYGGIWRSLGAAPSRRY